MVKIICILAHISEVFLHFELFAIFSVSSKYNYTFQNIHTSPHSNSLWTVLSEVLTYKNLKKTGSFYLIIRRFGIYSRIS
jgi:hypothetical protein